MFRSWSASSKSLKMQQVRVTVVAGISSRLHESANDAVVLAAGAVHIVYFYEP
jgi:hypothetical protein